MSYSVEDEVASQIPPFSPNRSKPHHAPWSLKLGASLELGGWRLELSHFLPRHATRFYYQRTASIEPQLSRDSVTYRTIDTLLLFSEKHRHFTHSTQYPCPFREIPKTAFPDLMQKLFFELAFPARFASPSIIPLPSIPLPLSLSFSASFRVASGLKISGRQARSAGLNDSCPA